MIQEGSSTPQGLGTRATRLLRAARDLLGSDETLAVRLGLDVARLRGYIEGADELPAEILLSTVDLLLEERESRAPLDDPRTYADGEPADGAGLPA